MATLFVVATPIGNLADLSPRAAQVLGEVELIAAEGVRRSRKLLSHLGISGRKLLSCREANRKRAAARVLEVLGQGRDAAYVSDAGTPGISDPGSYLVRQVAAAGHRVSPLPGPSALAAGLSVAGLEGPLAFLGFLPVRPGPRRKLLAQAADLGWALALFEAPHRLARTAGDLLAALGERPVVLCRELSKLHEEVSRTTLAELAGRSGEQAMRGEVTLLVSAGEAAGAAEQEVDRLLRDGLAAADASPSRLAARVAAQTGLGRKDIYRRLMELKAGAGAGGPLGQHEKGNQS